MFDLLCFPQKVVHKLFAVCCIRKVGQQVQTAPGEGCGPSKIEGSSASGIVWVTGMSPLTGRKVERRCR